MKKVLLVDDEPEERARLIKILRNPGLDITEAPSGPRAVTLIKENEGFDIVISDFELPGLNGLEVLFAAKNAKSESRRFLMSARRFQPSVEEDAKTIGVERLFAKPDAERIFREAGFIK